MSFYRRRMLALHITAVKVIVADNFTNRLHHCLLTVASVVGFIGTTDLGLDTVQLLKRSICYVCTHIVK